MTSLPATDGDGPALDNRVARRVPPPRWPVAFRTDPETLGRVADRLRALDDWHLSATAGLRSGLEPAMTRIRATRGVLPGVPLQVSHCDRQSG